MAATFRTAILLLGSLGIPVSAAEPVDVPKAVLRVTALRYPRNVDQLRLLQTQVQQVATQAIPATVGILVGQGAGSGVIVSADGLVLTAGHVIGEANRRASVRLPDGRRLFGKTLGANHAIDAGMIQLEDPPADLPFLPVAKMRAKAGDWVITLGQPGGVADGRSPPLRLGRVLGAGDDWICSDCTLVGGDSGGPLVNLRGEVIAVHSSIGPQIVHNFHIPVVEIHKNWERMLAGEVWGTPLTDVKTSELRPLMGVAGRSHQGQCLITDVFQGFPAFEAGVLPGDVVQAVDGEDITTFEEVSQRVLLKNPGDNIKLRIERDGKTLHVELVLAGIRQPAPRDDSRNEDSGEGAK